jgi:hypothetical protein
LAELPELPTQEGLICQEWNWNLADAQEYVAEYGVIEVGATYITDDGKTRLYIEIATKGRMDVPLFIQQTITNGVTIDWGDGSATETLSGTGNVNTTHKYADIGKYAITLDVAEGCVLSLGYGSSSYCVMGSTSNYGRAYCNMLQKVEIGDSVTSIGNSAFYYCYSLSSVIIPNSVTSIGNSAFYYCSSLSSVIIPNSVTSIGNSAFYYCSSLSSVIIPNSVTSIGNYAFQNCLSLSSVIIPNSVTSISNYAFQNCLSLSSVIIPNSVTSISSYAFSYCSSLSSVIIPNNVTSISTYAFQNCYSLSSMIIPNGVTSIGTSAFQNCYGVAFYDFSQHTVVPTLSATNVFNNIPSDCKIIVPDALYDEWINATNWTTYASKIVKASEYEF